MKPCYVFGFDRRYWKDSTMIDEGKWMFKRNDVVFHTLPSNIHVLSIDHYFIHVFVE
jgi:hypothetical protein